MSPLNPNTPQSPISLRRTQRSLLSGFLVFIGKTAVLQSFEIAMAVEAHVFRDNNNNSNLGIPFSGSLDSTNDGFGFGFNLQFQPQPQQFLLPQQIQSNNNNNNNFVFSAMKPQPSTASMAFSQSMTSQAEKQRREIDGYINLQNERLKLVLQEQRRHQLAAILRKLEGRTALVMRQKNEELALANKRTIELQEFMKRLEMENQAWKRIAGENESMIANLNAAIEQLREKATLCQTSIVDGLEDAESCCDENDEETGDVEVEETGERNSKRRKMTMECRSCNSRNSSVLFLPCRHLCCCTACEAFLNACPVCNSAKKGTIEALIS